MLEHEVGELLTRQRKTLALAESCTGGLLGHRITNVPGCSAYYAGSVVAYPNRVKREVLTVPQSVLDQYGGVSAPTALAMAHGVRQLLKADIGIGITGIAGPTGGSPGKPVGLVYIALVDGEDFELCREFRWTGDREGNKRSSTEAALAMLKAYLQDERLETM